MLLPPGSYHMLDIDSLAEHKNKAVMSAGTRVNGMHLSSHRIGNTCLHSAQIAESGQFHTECCGWPPYDLQPEILEAD